MLDAAAEMFSRKGYSATTFRDVASEGAINNNSIFRRILNKQDLYKQALQWESDKIQFQKLIVEAQVQFDPSSPSNIENIVLVAIRAVTECHLAILCLRAMEGECDLEVRDFADTTFIMPVRILLEAFLNMLIDAGSVERLPTAVLIQSLLGPVLAMLISENYLKQKTSQDARSLAGRVVQQWLNGVKRAVPS